MGKGEMFTDNVKVGICIPCYENVEYLERLLDSLKVQTFKEYIVCLTDDSSGNAIQAKVDEYRDKFTVLYEKNDVRLGATANCNKAMAIARERKAAYLKIMHYDDFFSFPDSLEKMVRMIEENPQADIAFTGTNQVGRDKIYSRAITEQQEAELKKDFRYIFTGNVIGSPSAVIVRSHVGDMDENLVWLVDVEWYLRILKENSKYVFSREPLISIGISENQLTQACLSNKEIDMKENIYVYQRHSMLHRQFYSKKLIDKMEIYMKQ